jgi:hypothetical protein
MNLPKDKKHYKPPLAVSMLFLMLSTSCSILPFGSLFTSGAAGVATQPAGAIYYDDFSSNTSGWDRTENDLGGADYLDGKYHFIVDELNTDYFSTLYRNYSDIGLQVDAHWVEGPYDNDYGLLCRYQDEKNFYAGLISSDGYYGIFKIENGEYTVLGHDGMMPSEILSAPDATYHLRLECYQDFLFFYVNDTLLDVQQDTTFPSGDVGLVAGSFESAGVHVAFDNFYLIDPNQSSN